MKTSQYPEAAFLSAMTASATHEVRNVLAIIKESAGLIDDLVRLSEKGGSLDSEKVRRAVKLIDVQVRRGSDLLSNLNRLSHAVDQDRTTVELGPEVEQVVYLSQRFARGKGQSVEVGKVKGGGVATGHPLLLQMVLFAAMERCLDELPEGASVILEVREENGASTVDFLGVVHGGGDAGWSSEPEGWEYLEALAETLGAEVERFPVGFGIRIHFS